MSYCVTDCAYASEIQDNETATSQSVKTKKCNEMRLPPFIESDPELWFALADSTFSVYGIKQDTKKYLLILENIEIKYARMVRDEILKGCYDYNSLKKQVIKQIRESVIEKMESEEMGERTPKEFLIHLKSMAGVLVPESTLQIIWRKQLPEDVRTMVELNPSRNLANEVETAELMNRMFSAAAQEKRNMEIITDKVDSMATEIEQLKRRISELEGCDDGKETVKRKRSKSCTEDNVE